MVARSSAMPTPRKEQPEQDAAERLDIGLELVAKRTLRQEHAGEECAHGHRQAAEVHRQRRAKDNQQGGRGHHLARAGLGENAKHRIEQEAPDNNQSRQRSEGHAHRDPAVGRGGLVAARCEEGDEGKQRHDGDVFQQQDRNDPLALRCRTAHPDSLSTWKTIAVEVSVKPMPNTKEMVGEKPINRAMPVSAAPDAVTCRTPRPRISRLNPHRPRRAASQAR